MVVKNLLILATIRNADLIYCLNNGKIVESGTHNELMNLKAHYYSLVINQETSQMSDLNSDSNLQLTKTKLIEKEEDQNKPADVSISLTTESKDEKTKKV